MSREGPAQVSIKNFDAKGSTKIKDCEVENTGNNFENVRGDVLVNSGKWYYEVKLLTYGKIHIGWCTPKCQIQPNTYTGVGNDEQSWGFDGSCQRAWHGSSSSNDRYGEYWNNGDIIGCLLDLDAKTISYYRNGHELGVAFSNVVAPDGLYPAASLQKKQKISFNFGKDAFRYNMTEIYPDVYPLHLPITTKQQEELEKLFEKYRAMGVSLGESSETEEIIKGDALAEYVKDMGITDDLDPGIMLVAWKLKVNHGKCWEFSREEFVGGWSILGATNIPAMRKKLDQWKEEVKNPGKFKQFYNYVFDWLKEERKILGIEEALTVWEMLGMQARWPLMGQWLEFLKDKKAISRDTWRLFLNFTEQYPKDLSSYDSDGCWPSLIDEFVDQVNKK